MPIEAGSSKGATPLSTGLSAPILAVNIAQFLLILTHYGSLLLSAFGPNFAGSDIVGGLTTDRAAPQGLIS